MEKIQPLFTVNPEGNNFEEVLGISEERADEIGNHIERLDLNSPQLNMKELTETYDNPAELAYAFFAMGMAVEIAIMAQDFPPQR